MPELPVLLSPDFAWPDLDLPMHGAAFFEAADEKCRAPRRRSTAQATER
jgi:hypothetical protein